jgi:hypothetical protein
VSPVKYELGFYIPEDDILHSYRRENLVLSFICIVFFLFSSCLLLVVAIANEDVSLVTIPETVPLAIAS